MPTAVNPCTAKQVDRLFTPRKVRRDCPVIVRRKGTDGTDSPDVSGAQFTAGMSRGHDAY